METEPVEMEVSTDTTEPSASGAVGVLRASPSATEVPGSQPDEGSRASMEEVAEGVSHQAPQGRGDVSVAELGRRLAEKDGVIQSLQDRLETVELWSQKLEEDRARERAEHAQERLRWERQVFELNLDSKRTTSRLKEDHQRVVSEMEARLRKLEAELRGEKSERIKRAMQTGGMAQQAMDISDAELPHIETLEEAKARIAADQRLIHDLRENVESCEELFNRLLVVNNNNTTDINEAKQLMLSGAAEFPDVIPTRWFCEASPDEVRTALLETTRKELSFKEFNDVMLRIDSTIRDASFDPFKRREGQVVGVDYDHMVLRNITEDLGRPVADLIIEKKREVEKYCPSGCYPTEVLYEDDHELSLPEGVARLLHALKVLRIRLKRKKGRYTLEPGAFRRQQNEDAGVNGEGGGSSAPPGNWTAWTSDNAPQAATGGRNPRREATVMDPAFLNQFRQWLMRSFASLTNGMASTQTSCVVAFVRKLLQPNQRVSNMDEARELLERHNEEFTREIEEGRAMGNRTALRRFRLFVRHDGQILEAPDEVVVKDSGGRGMGDEDEDDWSDQDGGGERTSSQPLSQGVLDRFARYLMDTTSIQEVTIKDYTLKVTTVLKAIMPRVNYTGGQIQNEDQLVEFYKAHSSTFIEYMQALGTASVDRAKRSALRYLMQYLGQVDDNPLWARHHSSASTANEANKHKPADDDDDEGRDDGDDDDDDQDGHTHISRDFKVLGDDLRRRFKRWLLEKTSGNSRPLADGTAREHCMSMNNLLRRIMVRVSAPARCYDEMPPVRTFILSHLAVFKTECSRLTYGRVTAMRYFLRFLGIEKKVEEGRGIETAGEAPAATRNSPGRGRRGEQASESTTLALARPIRKSFKRYLKRSHGASASGAKAQLQLVMGVLSAVMTEQKRPIKPLDRDGCILFIADSEAALNAELRRASRSGHKAEGWQNFLRFLEGHLLSLPVSGPGESSKRASIEMDYSDDLEEVDVSRLSDDEGGTSWADDTASSSSGSQDAASAGHGLLDGQTSEEFQSWLVANTPVAAKTAVRYTKSLVRMVRQVMEKIGFEPPSTAMSRDALTDFMEANQKAMEAEKAALQDKSAKAAIKYFYDFMKAAASHSGHARESWPALKSPTPSTSLKRKRSSPGPRAPEVDLLGPDRSAAFQTWCRVRKMVDQGLAADLPRAANRVLSRVWHAEHGLEPASVMADEALKAWMVSREGKVARLVSKDKSDSRAATAVALLWEYVMGEPWTQVPPRVEYEYLSDSSVEGKGMGYLHPVAVHKTRLGPDDDSSEEERLGLAALQDTGSVLSTNLSRRLQRWLLRSGRAISEAVADRLSRSCQDFLSDVLWKTQQADVTRLKRLQEVRALLELQQDSAPSAGGKEGSHSHLLLTQWLKDAEQEVARREAFSRLSPDTHPTAATVLASLPAARADLPSVSDGALTAYIDWLWSSGSSVVKMLALPGAAVAAIAGNLRSVVEQVMAGQKGMGEKDRLDTVSDLRDFFLGQEEALEAVYQQLEGMERGALAYHLSYLWQEASSEQRPPRLEALVARLGDETDLEACEWQLREGVDDGPAASVLTGPVEAALRRSLHLDESSPLTKFKLQSMNAVVADLLAKDGRESNVLDSLPDLEKLLTDHVEAVKNTLEGTAWLRRAAMSSLLSVLPRRSAGSATSSSEDEDDGDQSPRPVQGMATRVSDEGAAMDDDTAWPITSLVELGLVHGFKRALASRSDLGEEEKQAYPRLVQSVVQKVAQRARLDRIKSLQKVDIRPFYEDNKQAFEDLWRRAGGQRLRTAWELFIEHTNESISRRASGSDSSSEESESEVEEAGGAAEGEKKGGTGRGVKRRAAAQEDAGLAARRRMDL